MIAGALIVPTERYEGPQTVAAADQQSALAHTLRIIAEPRGREL